MNWLIIQMGFTFDALCNLLPASLNNVNPPHSGFLLFTEVLAVGLLFPTLGIFSLISKSRVLGKVNVALVIGVILFFIYHASIMFRDGLMSCMYILSVIIFFVVLLLIDSIKITRA